MNKSFRALLYIGPLFLFACAPPPAEKPEVGKPEGKVTFLEDIAGRKIPSAEELAEDRSIVEAFRKRKALITRIAKEDVAEQRVMIAKKKKLEKARSGFTALTRKLLEKAEQKEFDSIINDIIMAALKPSSNMTKEKFSEFMMAVNRGDKTVEEFRNLLRENTTLSAAGITNVVAALNRAKEKRKELERLVASTTDLKELEKILKERSGLTDKEISSLVKQKGKLLAAERNLKEDALARIKARLLRNRRLKIDLAFCAYTASLDQFVLPPSHFGYDIHKMDKATIDKFVYEMELMSGPFKKHPELLIQVEGNADERGSDAYNKALGDRRWFGPKENLLSVQFDDDVLKGLSKGEECALKKKPGQSMETWWALNRRIDYVFKLN